MKIMVANRDEQLKLFRTRHEDEIRARYENRNAYDFLHVEHKKRKMAPKKAEREMNNSSRIVTRHGTGIDDVVPEDDVFHPALIPDSLLVRSIFILSYFLLKPKHTYSQ